MKTLKTIVFLLISTIALGQKNEHLTAVQILDSAIAFIGGEERIAEIKSSSINYHLLQPDSSTAIITEKRRIGKKYVQSVLSMTHVPQTTFFDGNELARIEKSTVTRVSDIESIEGLRLRTFHHIQYGYKVLDYDLDRLADQNFENFQCYVLTARADNGYTTINYFDKTNYRLLMVVYPNGNKSLMIDYIFKDGVLFNSQIMNTFADSEEKQVLTLRNINLNIEISDLWFNSPYKDRVYTPPHIMTGEFESTNGVKTVFLRTEISQDYKDDQDKLILRRFLKWTNDDTYGLIDENAIKNNDTSPESLILVRIISWDDKGYVCHWIAGKNTDTQDYKINE